MLNTLRPLVIPSLFLSLAYYLNSHAGSLLATQSDLVKALPVVIAVATLLISFRFNRSRIFFVALGVITSYALLYSDSMSGSREETELIRSLLCLYLPFCFIVYSSLKERGIFSWQGAIRFLFLISPILIAGLFIKFDAALLESIIYWQVIPGNDEPFAGFSQLSMIVFACGILLMNGLMFIKPGHYTAAMFISLIACFAMLYHDNNLLNVAVYASMSLLIMMIAVIHESWSMAYLDQLTNLPARRALDEELLKLGNNYSIAMLDIDHFKKFNDRYGHEAGDQVLKMVAAKIKQIGGSGKSYRYGGEEFSVIFPGKLREDVVPHLETLRENISSSNFLLRKSDRRQQGKNKYRGKHVRVTISIGVASRNDKYSTPLSVIVAADKALYRAKKYGRNCVRK